MLAAIILAAVLLDRSVSVSSTSHTPEEVGPPATTQDPRLYTRLMVAKIRDSRPS